ncbi:MULTISPECIES: FAD-dependent oxidoreductase [unclassified Variovorax]|uniref:FAD-dependent oxidoreductase n=1 Tax=unclassified Variovorax TaxID=663243 RepID=UPI00076D1378|nr:MULTISPECIES: FAD-dependent oxidoreductase [unclassified Variovorax]KWT97038.1 Fumarate reductase flavoprotein subunit [Variovorax sp. WDL1]PNG47039.1 Fumarate reductase flavoprotein subunit [Variovorax sp. B2]PNG48310.1 Fumarate reductase flavoprotein subunit [Variovorax sp. B4]VTV14895.1 Fumarate reductase flavoprotein subunit precursor [Variovorax sp. WDL1]
MAEQQFDLVVAGCGVAGLSAAVAAAEAGAKVAVIERATRDERGGQSRYTEAYLRMKSLTEVTDDFETHLAENGSGAIDPELVEEAVHSQRGALAKALSIADPSVIERLSAGAGETIAWLQGMGVRFDFLPTQFLTKSQPRLLPVGGGAALVEALAARAEQLNVRFFYETTASALQQDADGRVVGLKVRTRSAGTQLLGGQVVLACGGFEGNAEMMTRYVGPRSTYLRPVCKGGYYNRGEGIAMGLDAGAAASGDFGSYHAEPVDPRSGIAEPSIFIFPYGILVNLEGRRFTDEAPGTVDAYYERVTRRIYEQREGTAWVVLDARHTRIPNYRLGIRTDKPPVVGDTLSQLARKIGVPADALEATVNEYNAACAEGEWRPLELDGLATRGLAPPKSNWATPLTEGPFHAYPIISSNVFTFGGLKTDASARVVDGDGEPIAGLFAAGETAGIYYRNYTGATSVLRGLVFGRIAGAFAAASRS